MDLTADKVSTPYAALASVYDVWTRDNDYRRWATAIRTFFDQAGRQVDDILDVCCGTGSLSIALGTDRYRLTGVDGSAEMLELAARRLGDSVRLIQARLPSLSAISSHSQDAVVCSFDSLNYLAEPSALAEALSEFARVLRPGGVLVFDVNSLVKMRDMFGDSHYGDDLEDFAYVWRNHFDSDAGVLTFRITLFRRREGGTDFSRAEEVHVQRHLPHSEILDGAARACLELVRTSDDYSDRPIGDTTLRETWVFRSAESR